MDFELTGASFRINYPVNQLMAQRSLKSRSPGRREAGARTRAAILAAAERVFARSGLAGARIDVIAAEAGVNKALLYYYFRSKEKLYQAVLEDHFQEFNRQALAVLAGAGSARDILLRYVSLHFDFISARHRHAPLFQQFVSAGGALSETLVRKYFTPRILAFGKLLERGMREGEFRRTDRFHTAVSIVALIVFYFSAAPVLRMLGHADAYGGASLKRRKREVLDFVRHGLFLEPASPPA
jgi:TetR/AcrR family transcriptional regulator